MLLGSNYILTGGRDIASYNAILMVKHILLRGVRLGFVSVEKLGMLYTGLPQDPI